MMPDEPRRFPTPWSAEEADPELDRRCFIVRDANRQALAYVYFEGELEHRSAAHLLTATRPAASPPTSPSCRSWWWWQALRHQKLPAAFSGPARGLSAANGYP
jgi:hypothetical protein